MIGSDLLSAAEATQAVGKIGGEVGFGGEGFVAGRKGGRTVGGKQERGGEGFELLGPVGFVRGKGAGGALGLLFVGVAGVAGGGGEGGGRLREGIFILAGSPEAAEAGSLCHLPGLGEFVDEDAEGPAVTDDVVGS